MGTSHARLATTAERPASGGAQRPPIAATCPLPYRARVRARRIAVGLAALLSAGLSAARAAGEPHRGGGVHFLALGDSYTIGEAVGERERWPEQLAARLRERGLAVDPVEIVARTGWTTEELGSAVDATRLGERYDLVTLLVGVNDQYRGQVIEAYRARFRRLLAGAIARAGGDPKRVVVVSIPDWGVTPFATGRDRAAIGAAIDAFNRVNRAEARRARCGTPRGRSMR